MNNALYFKALQSKKHYRNSDSIKSIEEARYLFDQITLKELKLAEEYLESLNQKGIQYTYIGDRNYPHAFYQMIEPPLFLEYVGEPLWNSIHTLSVVGSRKIHSLTRQWFDHELEKFVNENEVALVSGGAEGVDQYAHLVSVKLKKPTIVVLPCGLNKLFPQNLENLKQFVISNKGCFISEFSLNEPARKSHFYFRNRLIAAFSKVLLVAQAEIKSGTSLTVHHALQNGKVIMTIPAHPMMKEFSGNLKLIEEGACCVATKTDLVNYWQCELR